jgi:hypothetical protein
VALVDGPQIGLVRLGQCGPRPRLRAHPLVIVVRLRFGPRVAPAVAQEKGAQPRSGAQQVAAGILTRPDKIARLRRRQWGHGSL